MPVADTWGDPGTLRRHFADHGADFGLPSAEAYAQGVYFFDDEVLPFIDRDAATLGQSGKAHFFMPVEDSTVVTDAASAHRFTGGTPGMYRAYTRAGDVYAVEFPLEGFSPRIPTAADAGGWPTT